MRALAVRSRDARKVYMLLDLAVAMMGGMGTFDGVQAPKGIETFAVYRWIESFANSITLKVIFDRSRSFCSYHSTNIKIPVKISTKYEVPARGLKIPFLPPS